MEHTKAIEGKLVDYFKDMIDEGIFDSNISYLVEAIRFCYMGILQNELNETISLWNSHRIRPRSFPCPFFKIEKKYPDFGKNALTIFIYGLNF